MKTSVVIFAVLCAMVCSGQIIENPDPGFYQPSNGSGGVNIVPDSGFYQPSNGSDGVNIVPDSGFYQPSNGNGGVNFVPDSGFYRPPVNPNGPTRPDIGPTFVDNSGPNYPYPYRKLPFPGARGGN